MDKRQNTIENSRTMPTDNWYKVGYLLSIGDEKGAAKIIDYRLGNAGHMQQRALLLYMDSFTDKKLLFDLILSVYTNDGYDFPKRIIRKTKQLAKDIPEDERLHGLQSDEHFIRVWRGTTVKDPEAASLLRTSISWTTDNNPEWIDWASKKADWFDPAVAREDEFFGKRKHGLNADQKRLEKRWH